MLFRIFFGKLESLFQLTKKNSKKHQLDYLEAKKIKYGLCAWTKTNYGSGLRAGTIKIKQAIFPWELKIRKKYRVYKET